jgi:hypothetical protein
VRTSTWQSKRIESAAFRRMKREGRQCGPLALAGLAVALLASRGLASFLYGTSVRDPWVLVASAATLALVASAASLIPPICAAQIEPIEALRAE